MSKDQLGHCLNFVELLAQTLPDISTMTGRDRAADVFQY